MLNKDRHSQICGLEKITLTVVGECIMGSKSVKSIRRLLSNPGKKDDEA